VEARPTTAACERRVVSAASLMSVIVTTYNREDALNAVIGSLAAQSDKNFEIIVADDGSGPDTTRVVESWKPRLPITLKHVRHEHRGFRGGEIRNRGIRVSAGALCLFLDGDCLARPDFIAAHRRLHEPGWFVTGNRILLSREFTAAVLEQGLAPQMWNFTGLLRRRLSGGLNRLAPAVHLPLGPLRRLHSASWRGAQTCNLAVARSDLDRVDGFDNTFIGWGLEDSDLVVRLLRAGVRRKDGRFATGVLHLWHPWNDRGQLATNRQRLEETIGSARVSASRGLSTLAEEGEIAAHPRAAQQ
jgi:glycosyltransferase involved in cell wall biosynthesis